MVREAPAGGFFFFWEAVPVLSMLLASVLPSSLSLSRALCWPALIPIVMVRACLGPGASKSGLNAISYTSTNLPRMPAKHPRKFGSK